MGNLFLKNFDNQIIINFFSINSYIILHYLNNSKITAIKNKILNGEIKFNFKITKYIYPKIIAICHS